MRSPAHEIGSRDYGERRPRGAGGGAKGHSCAGRDSQRPNYASCRTWLAMRPYGAIEIYPQVPASRQRLVTRRKRAPPAEDKRGLGIVSRPEVNWPTLD
jgi:hypothetical protein